MIKAILFDLGNVIVPFDFKRGYMRIAPLCGCSPEEIPRRIRASGLVPKFETGHMTSEVFFSGLSDALNLKITYSEFCSLWTSIFLEGTLIPESLFESLQARYRLLLLSNTNPIHFSMVRDNYPLLRHFHDCILSYEVGYAKPSPQIYREAIARAGCEPEECFFTDDIQLNIDAARGQGMDAVQFVSADQVRRELNSRGIEV